MRDYYTHYPRSILWLIEGGEITIGGDERDAQPPFEVAVESFYLSKFPITNEQFEAFDPGYERFPVSPDDGDPAVGISYDEAAEYCRWYASVSRKKMRLPSEVEWEYACRGGSGERLFFGNAALADEYVWDRDNSGGRIPPLDQKKANGFGLWGMLGGVWEWTSSLHLPYPLPPAAATTTVPGDRRVLRGGSFKTARDALSCSARQPEDPSARRDDVGFRIARSLR